MSFLLLFLAMIVFGGMYGLIVQLTSYKPFDREEFHREVKKQAKKLEEKQKKEERKAAAEKKRELFREQRRPGLEGVTAQATLAVYSISTNKCLRTLDTLTASTADLNSTDEYLALDITVKNEREKTVENADFTLRIDEDDTYQWENRTIEADSTCRLFMPFLGMKKIGPGRHTARLMAKNRKVTEAEFTIDKGVFLDRLSGFNGMKIARVGDIVQFGNYTVDYDLGNDGYGNYSGSGAPIRGLLSWRVLSREGSRLLLLCEYYLEPAESFLTWEGSKVRRWLNGEFLSEAFSAAERAAIPTVTVPADKNPEAPEADQGPSTQDKVFLLSAAEVLKYLPNDADREPIVEKSGQFATYSKKLYTYKMLGIETSSINRPQISLDTEFTHLWMLRTVGITTIDRYDAKGVPWNTVAVVGFDGKMELNKWTGDPDQGCKYSVRPAVWVDTGKGEC